MIKWRAVLLNILVFSLGLMVSLLPYSGNFFGFAIQYKIKQLFDYRSQEQLNAEFSSSRYEFKLLTDNPVVGTFQIAAGNGKLFALNRNTGKLLVFQNEDLERPKELANVYILLGLQSSFENNPPLVMDLHFFRGYLYFSIARNNSSNTCQFLELDKMRFTSNIFDSRIERVFRTPCIEDLDNVVMWGGRITSSKQKLFL